MLWVSPSLADGSKSPEKSSVCVVVGARARKLLCAPCRRRRCSRCNDGEGGSFRAPRGWTRNRMLPHGFDVWLLFAASRAVCVTDYPGVLAGPVAGGGADIGKFLLTKLSRFVRNSPLMYCLSKYISWLGTYFKSSTASFKFLMASSVCPVAN